MSSSWSMEGRQREYSTERRTAGTDMLIERKEDGATIWTFYRKQYRKARYRRWGQRAIKYLDKKRPGWSGLIVW